MNNYHKFYQKNRLERIDILFKNKLIDLETKQYLEKYHFIPNNILEHWIENYIYISQQPFAVATNFIINNQEYVIPMVIEEPSVVAAASNGAKKLGNIETKMLKKWGLGEIALYDIEDLQSNKNFLLSKKEELINIANNSHPSINKRGGGVKDLNVEIKNQFLIIYLEVDCCDAMGANIINTMLEELASYLKNNYNYKILMSIVSNLPLNSLVSARAEIELDLDIANKMVLANKLAQADIHRAATHNKGIFNGIFGLVQATGNDSRAIEAAGHSYASISGKYQPLTNYFIQNNKLNLELTLPMPIATRGGTIGHNPINKISLEILKNPTAIKLAQIAVAVGLAQNFAAVYALVTNGIQKGHMALHAKTIAINAGAMNNDIEIVANQMITNKNISLNEAKKILNNLKKASN